MQTRFEQLNSDKLIIFLMGWGCDDNQFANMIESNKDFDLLLAWDYTNLDFPSSFDYSKYKEIYLLTYSAGVYVAGLIKENLPNITKSIAINGNPFMFDDHFGIAPTTLEEFRALDPTNALDFREKYLIKTREEFDFLDSHTDKRTFESYFTELDSLEAYSKRNFTPFEFDIAILSECDKIFNFTTQKEYFNGKYILLKNSAHNPFYHFQTFESILEFTQAKSLHQ